MAEKNKNLYPQKTKLGIPGLSAEEILKITKNLKSTLMLGMFTGIASIIGYALTLPKSGANFLFLFTLLGAASYISGFFLGFLFGIPKRNSESDSAYNLSANLEDISDWLTKIIIGLGLVEIKAMPGHLESMGLYIQKSVGGDPSVKIFSIFILVYFSIFGLYYGYNYMRLYLSGQYKGADDNLMSERTKELNEKENELNNENLIPNENIQLDSSTQKTLAEYDKLLKHTKTEAEYIFSDWYFKGVSAYNSKEYEKMIVYMKKALEMDRNDKYAADAYLYLGLAYSKLDRMTKAIENNSIIISSYPDYQNMHLVYYNNGIYYSSLKNMDKAIESYTTSIEINPNYALSYNNKADLLIQLGRDDEAVPLLDKAIQIDSTVPYPFYNLACIFAKRDEKDLMLKNLRICIHLNPEYKGHATANDVFLKYTGDPDFKAVVE